MNKGKNSTIKISQASLDFLLLIAADDGDITQLKSAIEMGANLKARDALGRTALFRAVSKNHEDTSLYLINQGSQVNVRDSAYNASIIGTAISNKSKNIAKALVEAGTTCEYQDPNSTCHPIHMSSEGYLEKALLGHTMQDLLDELLGDSSQIDQE